MKLTFSHEFPYPLEAVLKAVFSKAARQGTLTVKTEDAPTTAHSGVIAGEIATRLPAFLSPTGTNKVGWEYHYAWDPIRLERLWRIEPTVFRDRVKSVSGRSYYSSVVKVGGEYTWQSAHLEIELEASLFKSMLEKKVASALRKAAEVDRQQILDLLARELPNNGDEKMEIQDGGLWEEVSLGNLLPFWLGTIATSLTAGFFLGGSDEHRYIPFIFLILVAVLLFVAFATTGAMRKNVLGLFLGLFNTSFSLGWYVSQVWSP